MAGSKHGTPGTPDISRRNFLRKTVTGAGATAAVAVAGQSVRAAEPPRIVVPPEFAAGWQAYTNAVKGFVTIGVASPCASACTFFHVAGIDRYDIVLVHRGRAGSRPEGEDPSMTVTAYLGLGGNLGDRQAYLDRAIEALQEHSDISVTQISSIYETEPVGLVLVLMRSALQCLAEFTLRRRGRW